MKVALGLILLNSITERIPEEIWDHLDILDIHIAVRKCSNAYLIFEKRDVGWLHLATRFTLDSLNEYLCDLVTVETELQRNEMYLDDERLQHENDRESDALGDV